MRMTARHNLQFWARSTRFDGMNPSRLDETAPKIALGERSEVAVKNC